MQTWRHLLQHSMRHIVFWACLSFENMPFYTALERKAFPVKNNRTSWIEKNDSRNENRLNNKKILQKFLNEMYLWSHFQISHKTAQMQDIKKKKGIIPSHLEKKEKKKRKSGAYLNEKKWKPEWKHKMGNQWITYLMSLWMMWTKSNKETT